jgi:tetratricopeptide (TPR) repeat protein
VKTGRTCWKQQHSEIVAAYSYPALSHQQDLYTTAEKNNNGNCNCDCSRKCNMTEDRENSEEEPMDEGRFFDGDSSNTYDDPSRDDEDEEYSNSNSEGFESSYQSGSDDGSSYRSVENDGSVTSFDGIGDDLEKRKENEESFTDRCKDSYLENANAFRQQNFHGKEDRESLVDLKFGSSSSEKVDPFFSENRSKEYTEGNTNYKGSQSDGGRQVSENEESDDDDDGTSQSHSSRSKGSETNIVSKEESKDSFYEWGSFRSEDKRSVSLGDADSVDNSETLFCLKRPSGTKTNDDIDQPLFSLPARFQDPFFHNVDKKGTSFDRKNNFTKADGFDVAFGSNPFGGKQESQKDYYFDSEYNEHSQVSGTATAACGVYPLAKGGLSQNGFSAFDEHSQSSSNSVSDEDEGDFLMEEKLIEPDPLHPGNEKSRKNSSHVANEEEPLFGTKSESADREIEREREMLFSYSAHDDNHDVQFLGDCVVDMNQMGEDQEQNNKPDNRHASSENLKVDNADEGESSSDADNGVPLDRDENSDTSYFEKKESRPHHGRDEEDFDAGEESEASSPFQSSHTGSESDTSFKSNDEESRSSHQKETSFVSQSNTDIVSHPIPHGGDNSRSTNADDEAMEPLDNDNEPWHASFSASEQSRSTSLNEDTDESSSNSEDLESESHIDERDESFNPFFPSDEHFNSKPLLVDKSNKSDDVSVDSHENSRLGSSSGANGNEQWHASFTASEQSRSTPHNEDTDESSSRSENSEPESHIDEEDGSFSPFFPSDVHFNSKPLLVDESNKSDDVSVDSHENSRLGSSSGANGNEQWHASFTASEQSRSTSLEEGTDGSSRSEKPESESDIDEEDESFSPFFPSDVHFNSKPLLVDKSNKSDDVSVDSNEKSRSGSSGGANNESESSAFDSSQHADSVSSKDEVDESYSSSSDPSESSESLLEEVEQPFNTFSSEHNRADAEESWLPNDGDNDPSEVRSIEEAEESNSSSFEGSSHSGLRSFEDDASSSRGAAFDDSERSSSKSPSSESSRSRRAEVEKFDNASFENSAHSQAKSLKDANELSWNPKFNDNENPKASVPSFEGDESASWDTAVDDSVYYSSASLKQGTNESCSVSGFDSSEFSRSLRIEAKESFLPFVENSDKETSNSVLETSEVSRSESSRDKMHGSWHRPSEQLKIFGSKLPTGQSDGSWNSAFETSKLSGTESIKEEANESISTSSKTSHDSRPESSKSSDSADKSLGSRSNFTRDESNPSSKSDADNSQGSISKSTKDKSDQFFHASFEHSDHEQARSAEYGPQESMNSDDDEHSQAKVLQIDAERSRNASPDTSDHSKTGSSKNVANESHAGNFFSDNLDENSSHESSHTDSVVSGIIRESGTSDRESERPSLYKNSKLSGTDEETSDRSSKNSISNSDEGVENNGVELISNVPKADEANESATFDSRKDAKSTSSTQSRSSQDGGEDEDSSSGADPQQQKHKKDRDTSSKSEVSMMIGDVFGQPNELFEDFNRRERSSKSSELTDYMLMRKEAKDLIISESNNETDPKDTFLEAHENKFEEEENALNHDTQTKKEKIVISEKERRRKRKRKKQRRRRKKEAKSAALLDFAANVNETIFDLEDRSESDDRNVDSAANSLLHGFDALLGIFLQLSDELELIATFSDSNRKDEVSMVHVSALTVILGFAETFDQLFADLKPIILESFEEEPDEYMDDLFQRLDALVDLLCETSHRVGEKQEWNCRAETTYVTLLELIERDSLDLRCYFDDVDTPDPGISANVHEAWSATGHIEELKAIQRNDDPELFRQICYEVLVSTDQWCPDTDVLMEICGIDPDVLNEEPPQEDIDDDELAPIPQAAEHILDKVNGDTLPRLDAFTSILRRILPPRAVTDTSLLSHFTSVRNAIESPLGLSATNVVSISSVPESINDPNALGVAGVGKTTLAAMVAEHRDVRRHFIDGVVWVYLGNEELNYNRYTQCLRELVAQLDFYDGIPLFAELLHTPGENPSKRRRREEGFMIYARDTIAGLLKDRSVLIILDDVCFEPDMDWFDFAPMPDESTQSQGDNCALVITTRRRSLLPAADTVEIDMLDEADAITLLIQESGQLSHTLMAESKEARSVVRECANHPLAVKSIGRWLNLKHATAGAASSVEEIHSEVIKSMDKILKAGDTTGTDMMYEILSTSLSPAINGGPTNIIKFCFAAFIMVFCDRNHISEFELTEPTPIVPMDIAELLFQTLLEMYEVSLLQKGSLFHAQKKEAAVLIPEALSALGVLKVITYTDNDEEEDQDEEQKFLQVMHSIHLEYGVYLAREDLSLKDFTKDAERQWNRALVDAYQSRVREWDWDLKDAAHGYALEMIVSHMIRGTMYNAAATLLAEQSFIRGRLLSLGRENCTKRHIKDCEMLCEKLKERMPRDSKLKPRSVMKNAYQALGRELAINADKNTEDKRVKNVEVARAHYEIGFSLAENRCWDAAIAHWETSQELLMSALGLVEVVAGILYNIGVIYSELNEYEQALNGLKQCLKIRATIHGGRFYR